VTFDEMLHAVRRVHEQRHFRQNGGEDAAWRIALMAEELGEISGAITKGRGDLGEEHADLLILLLGNAVAFDLDLEAAFWRKVRILGRYRTSTRDGRVRLISRPLRTRARQRNESLNRKSGR